MNISRLCKCGTLFPRIFTHRINTTHYLPKKQLIGIRNITLGQTNFQKLSPSQIGFRSTKNYVVAIGILTFGLAYAAVPLYRIFCQSSGYGGTTKHDLGGEKIEKMEKIPDRLIKVTFNSDVSADMRWKFKPRQKEIMVAPGETALAFYTATNPLDEEIIGISTYNILPYEAGAYFNKIQCFCFEEQLLNPKEEVDMPVFFYIDTDFCKDPLLEDVDEIILSYTFFRAKDKTPFTFTRRN